MSLLRESRTSPASYATDAKDPAITSLPAPTEWTEIDSPREIENPKEIENIHSRLDVSKTITIMSDKETKANSHLCSASAANSRATPPTTAPIKAKNLTSHKKYKEENSRASYVERRDTSLPPAPKRENPTIIIAKIQTQSLPLASSAKKEAISPTTAPAKEEETTINTKQNRNAIKKGVLFAASKADILKAPIAQENAKPRKTNLPNRTSRKTTNDHFYSLCLYFSCIP